jgi:two-component system chemotaxis response regulator CheB
MAKIRVLVVDDSSVIRRLLADILSSDEEVEVVGTAPNGAIALQKIEQLNPDVITLDVEMPDMTGLEFLEALRKTSSKLPVIMFSSLTQKAAITTLEALARGATDYVTKPTGVSREAASELVRSQLLPKVKVLGGRRPSAAMELLRAKPRAVSAPVWNERPEVLAIGVSTGGPNALSTLFQQIPANLGVPVVIVQHMPPLFTQLLAERLTNTCPLTFAEAKDGDLLEAGKVWIAPGDFHMRLVRDGTQVRVALDQGTPENSCRPAVDVLFRSVASVYRSRSLAVIMTGMGQDGLHGCEAIDAAGGQIIVQDEASSVVWGMPGFVAKAGLARAVLPLDQLSTEILRRVNRGAIGPSTIPPGERIHAG